MNCENCGVELEHRSTGRPRRTCSDRCRKALGRPPTQGGRRVAGRKRRKVTKLLPPDEERCEARGRNERRCQAPKWQGGWCTDHWRTPMPNGEYPLIENTPKAEKRRPEPEEPSNEIIITRWMPDPNWKPPPGSSERVPPMIEVPSGVFHWSDIPKSPERGHLKPHGTEFKVGMRRAWGTVPADLSQTYHYGGEMQNEFEVTDDERVRQLAHVLGWDGWAATIVVAERIEPWWPLVKEYAPLAA